MRTAQRLMAHALGNKDSAGAGSSNLAGSVHSWLDARRSSACDFWENFDMSFKKNLLRAVAAAALILAASPAVMAGDQDFTLINHTGVEIHKFYTSPHSSDQWEEDVLGTDTLADGESFDVEFPNREKSTHWDIRVEDSKGNAITFTDINLKETSEVVLHYKDGKAWADLK
jgi:hypothetical protein